MNARRQSLALRREQLRLRSTVLRWRLAQDARVLTPVLSAADAVRAGVRWLGRHPAGVVGVTGVLVVSRPGRVWSWGLKLWSAWRLLGRAREALQRLPARWP